MASFRQYPIARSRGPLWVAVVLALSACGSTESGVSAGNPAAVVRPSPISAEARPGRYTPEPGTEEIAARPAPTPAAPLPAAPRPLVPPPVREGDWMTVVGQIVEIDGRDLVLDVAGQSVRIDTDDMKQDPVRDTDGLRLGSGDRISVYGKVDDLSSSRVRELDAKTIEVTERSEARRFAR